MPAGEGEYLNFFLKPAQSLAAESWEEWPRVEVLAGLF
jgi:hypothetical protein